MIEEIVHGPECGRKFGVWLDLNNNIWFPFEDWKTTSRSKFPQKLLQETSKVARKFLIFGKSCLNVAGFGENRRKICSYCGKHVVQNIKKKNNAQFAILKLFIP